MRYVRLVSMLVLLAAGCGKAPVVPAAAPSPPAGETASPVEEHQVDIGDVESAVRVEGVLAPESTAPNIAVDNLTGKNNSVVMSTVAVSPPFPAELWLNYTINSVSEFPVRPAVVQFTVYRDNSGNEEVLGSFAAVLGAGAHLPRANEQRTLRVNALAGIDATPPSLLLHTRGRLFLMPVGTDANSVDPQTAATAPLDTSEALQANPVRIEFATEVHP